MFRSFIFSLLLIPLLSIDARAQDLYSGEVVVQDQGAGERLQAIPGALIQVLQKHSGQRELPIHPALDAALVGANRILVSFFYREHRTISSDGLESTEWRLVANFLPEEVDQIIRDLELPRWRADRKPITIWIVVDDGQGRRLMPFEYEYAWNALKDIADQRGLPLSWPSMDEEQTQNVDLQLLWGGFTDELPPGASGAGDVAIVAARREGPVWNVRWNFGDGAETSGWRVRDTDLSFALVDGLHQLTDLVAARDAIVSAGQGNWQTDIAIGGFQNEQDYAACLSYLEGLGVVDEVNILEAGSGIIRFSLQLNAMPQYLRNQIERDGLLAAGLSDNEYTLSHRLPMSGPGRMEP